MTYTADAWFISAAAPGEESRPAKLWRGRLELGALEDDEVLLAPIYGCWEGNMGHALARRPIDTVAARGLERAVIGNSGCARVLEVGRGVRGLAEGQVVLMFGMETDRFGYPRKMMAYDAPIMGCLSTRMKLKESWCLPIPDDTRFDLVRWAGFNVRYVTAWANWEVALATFRIHLSEEEVPRIHVWGWGGGTALAEAQLATMQGHRGVALASTDERLQLIRDCGVEAVDRRPFHDLWFDEARYRNDREYAERYRANEGAFLEAVRRGTDGEGVQIFVDMIGSPVYRATTKALARQGVVTTAGWKAGMDLKYRRASACIERHQYVHTHFTRRGPGLDAVAFAEENEWLPIVDETRYSFDEIPELAERYDAGDFRMFPCYTINGE